MTKEFKFEDISYLSQYLPATVNDETFLTMFNHKLKNTNKDDQAEFKKLLIEIDKNMPNVDDKYNQIIFDKLYYQSYDLTSLENTAELVEALSKNDYEQVDSITDNHLRDIANEDIYDVETLHILINQDLKEDGIKSKFVYLVTPYASLERNIEYVKINAYLNGFDNEYTDYNLALKDTFEENYKEVFDEFFDKHFLEFSKGRQL